MCLKVKHLGALHLCTQLELFAVGALQTALFLKTLLPKERPFFEATEKIRSEIGVIIMSDNVNGQALGTFS